MKDTGEFLNKQMEFLQNSNAELNKIYESITEIQKLQKQHAELIRELATLLGFNEKEEGRIIV